MSTSEVVQLDDYRARRERRLRQTIALHAGDVERKAVVEHLGSTLALLGADRAAVVWVDEYGPGLVHVHALVDLASKEPRRGFALAPLKEAWEAGIPGLVDRADLGKGGATISPNGIRSQAVVSLGSDGSRAWFVVVDSLNPRAPVSDEGSEFLMFFAGECSAVVLHRDLPLSPEQAGESERLRRERFAGWPVLRDIEGREDDRAANHRISCRFMVARLVRRLVDDDLAVDGESLAGQVDGVRKELDRSSTVGASEAIPDRDSEKRAWMRVLNAAAAMDLEELAAAVIEAGNRADDRAHLYGAAELHRCAYDLAVAAESAGLAIDALRFQARAFRKLGLFDEAERWYERAELLAVGVGDTGRLVRALSGRTMIKRELGNLPVARELLEHQFSVAEGSHDLFAQAMTHHNWLALEKDAKNWARAVVHGWQAFRLYPEDADKYRALSDLTWILIERGEPRAAEDGFQVLASQSASSPARAMALEGLALVAAVRGDRAGFRERTRIADARRSELRPANRCQCMVHRAEGFKALGDLAEARDELEAALRMAESLRLNQAAIEVEEMLERLELGDDLSFNLTAREDTGDESITGVLRGLADLRAGCRVG